MRAIYGPRGIKGGGKERPRALLRDAARGLADAGAEVVIAGCTEIPLVLTREDVSVPVVDPLEVVARVAVRLARPGGVSGDSVSVPEGEVATRAGGEGVG